jgi:NAD(P)H dehydrogenase (quinone)
MDTASWYYFLVNRSPGHNSMKKGILEFSGIKPVRIPSFSPIKSSDDRKRKMWLYELEKLGERQI